MSGASRLRQGSVGAAPEKAYLMAALLPGRSEADAEESLRELARLAETAGAEVVGQALQLRKSLDPATYLGSGKVEAAKQAMQDLGAGLAIVDDELKPTQQRNLEEILGGKVLDRTQLILDVFAQRARTNEGKLQVELAQLSYLLPRLGGWGLVLSRLGGGIGTRGPGETKLESDRRRLRTRIAQLRREIDQISKTRGLQRRARLAARSATVALVGYTNAGKSSLFNSLTGADVFVQNLLFATLDPTIRPLALPRQAVTVDRPILLADTVGFINKLPHDLVAAFRATLEEVGQADLRLLVADAGSPYLEEQKRTVEGVLAEITELGGRREKHLPTWLVFNKSDLLSPAQRKALAQRHPEAFFISAKTGAGLEPLKERLLEHFKGKAKRIRLEVPAEKAGVIARHYSEIQIVRQKWKGNILEMEIEAPVRLGELKEFLPKRKRGAA